MSVVEAKKPKKIARYKMAMAVAEDVIKQLNRRKARLQTCHSYLSTSFSMYNKEGDLQEHVDSMQEVGCAVCARGALVLSKARLYDGIPMSEVRNGLGQAVTTNLLEDTFDPMTLEYIESAYERFVIALFKRNLANSRNLFTEKHYGAAVFGLKIRGDKARMIAIMKNVIENKGKFVVPPATKEEYLALKGGSK